MSEETFFPRRVLIGHGLLASFLLPAALRGRLAEAAPRPSAEPVVQGPGRKPFESFATRAPRLVVLDPGHGGKDPGAIGVSGTYEKHVALAAALELKRQLEATGRYRVELTRKRDLFIPLESRVAYAQAQRASVFVSLHADAVPDHSVRGASVYTLAAHASDAQTAALAARENAADRFAGPQFRGLRPEVVQILASLVRRETRIGSARLSHSLVASLNHAGPLLPNPERHAGFVVLKAADIPSVLVEMGFMSNRQDEAILQRQEHRKQVAAAMRRAIEAYFATADHLAHMAG